ncbi:hypothetical protein [Psychrobacillus glaciei]|uniref:hypothetical protein n=1 Tax=Psychrobacillus glaciei TaxID=2283160 RepID=UPI00178C4FF9|nr:hypothetical protein [Psychrobacillus glaciei]
MAISVIGATGKTESIIYKKMSDKSHKVIAMADIDEIANPPHLIERFELVAEVK